MVSFLSFLYTCNMYLCLTYMNTYTWCWGILVVGFFTWL